MTDTAARDALAAVLREMGLIPDAFADAFADLIADAILADLATRGYVLHPATCPGPLDAETLRLERHWPTPISMRRVAEALAMLTPARHGDVLQWFADLCDAADAKESDHDA